MRLTLQADYGFRLLIYLASVPDRLVSAREVAEVYAIPLSHLTKIIARLVQGNFVESVRGRNGGMRLAKPAEEIRLSEIAAFLDETDYLILCMNKAIPLAERKAFCRLAGSCRLRGVLGEALQAFMQVLGNYRLSDIITDQELIALNLKK